MLGPPLTAAPPLVTAQIRPLLTRLPRLARRGLIEEAVSRAA
ncbi:hypothetical protein GCM10010168_59340 [Actinoplanes ianthinogenes]|uniref:Uncharacterized protein n=1 Tax=Actinoplanes ianthinogenes TaxID=122358 RepID=A0ABM7M227_9ACTN|nr:hypothetical protein [Actinoplanes ianthinogenes]BCJ45645.1 hypothetical protein Aiant_63020 [Actinoplanes ianthinogenes]GGR32983.1 hypothetical protein GCM10010168_59340 [Actinoplanes ianthinogenes]